MNPVNLGSQKSYRDRLKSLCDLSISEDEAEKLWRDILDHQDKMGFSLGRSVDLMVAALDYLNSPKGRFCELVIVEKKEYQEAWISAYTDPLTGLYNRRYLIENLKREIEKSKRYHLSFSLIFFDLDHFKSVNDTYGHLMGDIVLQEAAQMIRSVFRASDLVARYGGEEFVVLMPQTAGQMAWKVGERLRRMYKQRSQEVLKSESSSLSLSGGVVSCPSDSEDMSKILKFADEALYMAKQKGRNRIYHYSEVKKESYKLSTVKQRTLYEKAS